MDLITRDALMHYASLYPGAAIRIQPFLSGPAVQGGFVPNEWNGEAVDVGYPFGRMPRGKGY